MKRVIDSTLHDGFGYFPFENPDLLFRLPLEDALVTCLRVDHPLAHRVQIHPDGLEGQAFIAVARELMPAWHEEIQEHLADFGSLCMSIGDIHSVEPSMHSEIDMRPTAFPMQSAATTIQPNANIYCDSSDMAVSFDYISSIDDMS